MSIDPVSHHFGQWIYAVIWAVVFILFLAFIPFYKKSQIKPAGVYTAFVVALALEMFGVPLSMYVITWVLGKSLPDGILWGHTLIDYIGLSGTTAAVIMYLTGGLLIFLG
jgi:methanethiol S-methyltransferase